MFEKGWTLFRVRGIPVRLHITLLLFLPYVALATAREFVWVAAYRDMPLDALRLPPLVWGLILAVSLFASILVHELAHSAVAVRNGARVTSITLMMLGGVSRLSGEVRSDREAWMAFAGPLASFVLGMLAYVVYRFAPISEEVAVGVFTLASMNLLLAAFNLLPAFPMDGGRVLRGLLSKRIGRLRATRITTSLGRGLAVLFGIWGLVTLNVILVLVALFVYMGATGERARLERRNALSGRPVSEILSTEIGEAQAHEHVGDVAQRLLTQDLKAAKVVDDREDAPLPHHTLGIVMANDLVDAASHGQGGAAVGDTVRADLPTIPESADGAELADVVTNGHGETAVVVDSHGEIVGIVTPIEIERAVALGSIRHAS